MSLVVISKMTAFKADFRNNACYGHAHNSCPGRCAVNQITIGNGTDFVMRMGATTYSHHVSVTFTPVHGTAMSESVSRSSLHTVLKELKQKLVPKGWTQSSQLKWKYSKNLETRYETSLGMISIQYHFISGLRNSQKDHLYAQFLKAFN